MLSNDSSTVNPALAELARRELARRFCRKNKDKIKSCGRNLFGIAIGAIDRAGEFELSNGKGRMISPAIESGHVYVPDAHQCPWVAGFIDQFTGFPNVKNDDMVDAASQALNRLIYCSGEPLDDRPRRPQPYIRFEDFYDPYGMY